MRPQSVSTLKPPFDLNLSATPPAATGGNRLRVCLSCFKCTGLAWHWFAGQHIKRLTVSGRFSPEQMLALNSRQLSLLLFVVCHNHICSCYCRAPNNGRGLNIDGAWRIIMPRLTLARAVGQLLLSMPARHPTAGGLSYRARTVQYLMKVQTLKKKNTNTISKF